MEKNKPKSGKITISLSASEVRNIIAGSKATSAGHVIRLPNTVIEKLHNAILGRFADEASDEMRVNKIWHEARESDEVKHVTQSCAERLSGIRKLEHEINDQETKTIEGIIQSAFDKAGITKYKARSYGFTEIDGK